MPCRALRNRSDAVSCFAEDGRSFQRLGLCLGLRLIGSTTLF